MLGQTKSFGPNKRVTIGSKKNSRIMDMSRKQYRKTQANMRHATNRTDYNMASGSLPDEQFSSRNIYIGQRSAKVVNNSVVKGASKSNLVPTSKGIRQPTTSRFGEQVNSVEKQKALSRSRVGEKVTLKVSDPQPTPLKAMSGLVPNTINKFVYYDNSQPLLKKRAADGNERQDGTAIGKENVKDFGEHRKEGDTVKVTLDSRFIERNMDQYTNCVSKKRKEPMFEENPKAIDVDSNARVQVDNTSCRQMKKLKQSRVRSKDEVQDDSGKLNHVGVQDDTISISKKDHVKVSMPSCVERQCYSCLRPIDKPTWSGIFKTDDKKYVSMNGHLSTKSCERAWNLSRQLLKVVEVKKISRLEVWPKAWEGSTPTGNDIGIYFFPHEMRHDEGLDQLVREVMDNDLALRAIIGEAEMLIFPSIILPNHHQTFQRKYYLWGVFKHRQDKGVVVEEVVDAMGHCEKERQENLALDQPNLKLPGEEPNQDMIWMASTIPFERHRFPPNENTQEVEATCLKGPTKMGFDLKALGEQGGCAETTTPVTTDAATFHANHGQIKPSMGHTPDMLIGFVVRKTPKIDRIIEEIEQEGAVVFAMQGKMVDAGSWAASKTTAIQK